MTNNETGSPPFSGALNRRAVTRQIGDVATSAAAAIAASSLSPVQSSDAAGALARGGMPPARITNPRVGAAYQLRMAEATRDATMGPAVNINNGDTARYADKGGTYTKGQPHDGYGRVNPTPSRHLKPPSVARPPRTDSAPWDGRMPPLLSRKWPSRRSTWSGTRNGSSACVRARNPSRASFTCSTGADAGQLTVTGELNKLDHNVSFGHGIHAGIHFRGDTDSSLPLGEEVALNFLRNRARTYNEPFSVRITRFDGRSAIVPNGSS